MFQSAVMMQETLHSALAAQSAEHERRLEAALAARDAEALEALRLLDEEHRNSRRLANGRAGSSASSSSSSASASLNNDIAPQRKDELVVSGGGDAIVPATALGSAVYVDTPGAKKRRERHRARPSSAARSSSGKAHAVPARRPREVAAGAIGVPAITDATAVAIKSAAAARDQALREAREESDRLEEALSSGCSEPFSSPQSSTGTAATVTARSDAAESMEYFPYDNLAGTLTGSPGGAGISGVAAPTPGVSPGASPQGDDRRARYLDTSAVAAAAAAAASHAPAWTVGAFSPVRYEENVGNTPGQVEDAAVAADEPAGISGGGGRPAALRSSGNGGGGSTVVAAGEDQAGVGGGAGLTKREQRYRRELWGLRGRVRELEGMMERRMDDRERVYRGKLRAAVAECRSLKVLSEM